MGEINGITAGTVTGSLKEAGEKGGIFCGGNGLHGIGGWTGGGSMLVS